MGILLDRNVCLLTNLHLIFFIPAINFLHFLSKPNFSSFQALPLNGRFSIKTTSLYSNYLYSSISYCQSFLALKCCYSVENKRRALFNQLFKAIKKILFTDLSDFCKACYLLPQYLFLIQRLTDTCGPDICGL